MPEADDVPAPPVEIEPGGSCSCVAWLSSGLISSADSSAISIRRRSRALRFHWTHQLMNLHFVLVGYLFFWPLIGVDAAPHRLPHLGRLAVMLATTSRRRTHRGACFPAPAMTPGSRSLSATTPTGQPCAR